MEKQNIRKQVSYSQISLFNTCPTQYYFKYIVKDQTPETVWPGGLFGSAVHLGAEDAIKMKNEGVKYNIIEKELKDNFTYYFRQAKKEIKEKDEFKESKEYRLHKKEFVKSGNKALNSVIQFINNYIKDDYDKLYPEKRYKIPWNKDLDCSGIIDIKIEKDNKVYILDLKVTSDGYKFWWINWNNDIQSFMYDYLIYSEHKIIPEFFSYVIYDRKLGMLFLKNRNIIKPIEQVKEKLNKHITAIQNFRTMEEEEAVEYAKPHKLNCLWCAFKKRCKYKYEDKMVKKIKQIKK